jgi:hypothetical protein
LRVPVQRSAARYPETPMERDAPPLIGLSHVSRLMHTQI